MYAKELRREFRARAVAALPSWLALLPEAWGRSACAGLGRMGYWLVARDRRLARANLERVYPAWPRERIDRMARAVFEEIGRNAYDFLRYPDLDAARRRELVVWEGSEHLDALLRRGRGGVVVTAHLGSWEVLAAALVDRGLPLKAVARPLREPRLDALLRRHRSRMGVETLSSSAPPREAVRHVRRGGFLGVLMDQRVKRGGITVRFLDQPTRMTDGPARLALTARAPLLPVGISRDAGHRHVARILPPLETRGASSADLTQALADRLGRLIREHPSQWMWIHPRWSLGPRAEPVEGYDGSSEEVACSVP